MSLKNLTTKTLRVSSSTLATIGIRFERSHSLAIPIIKNSIFTVILLFCTLFNVAIAKDPNQYFNNEIIVRTVTNLKTTADVDRLVSLCQQYRIATVAVAFKQDEDDEIPSGYVFYPSSIAPVAAGYAKFDILQYLIAAAHAKKINIKAWIPKFHDQVAYKKNASWRMMVYRDGKTVPFAENNSEYFVNPLHPDVQKYELAIIKEIVTRYNIDGVVLDWIRFNGYNMDLSDTTRQHYKKEFGYDPLTIDFTTENSKRIQWNHYRMDGIASYIQRVKKTIRAIKPALTLDAFVLSPAWKELAQDPRRFAGSIDSISPMCYYDDWNYPVEWIYGKRSDAILPLIRQKVPHKDIIPVFDTNWDPQIYKQIFTNLHNIHTIGWFHYGKWTSREIRRISSYTDLDE